MGFFSRLKTGWALGMDSLGVLRREPELAIFPLVSGLAGILFLALVMGGSYFVVGVDSGVAMYAVLFVLYFGTTFIASFFTAALMHETREAFEGREPSFRGGLEAAWRNKKTLLAWATVAATVGVILRMIQDSDNPIARLLAGLFGVAWSILTYFVVPVIVFEEVTITQAIKQSGDTFKKTWGETAGATFGVGIVTVVFVVAALLVAVPLVWLSLGTGSAVGFFGAIAVAAGLILLAYLFGVTLGGIARTALYVYATERKKPSEFDNVDFDHMP